MFQRGKYEGTLVLLLLYIDKRVVNHDYILSLNSQLFRQSSRRRIYCQFYAPSLLNEGH